MYDVDFDGFDMLLLIPTTSDLSSISDPRLGIDLDGTDSTFLADLAVQGTLLHPDFGGSGPETLQSLSGLEVFATLIPEDESIFINARVDGGEARGITLADGEWAYLTEVSVGPAGDFDKDGDVDGQDFLVWQRNFGVTSGATSNDGDANGDGAVDGEDFLVWQANFGSSAGVGGGVDRGDS